MPIIKSAIKKVRKDKLRTARNKKREIAMKAAVKKARADKSDKNLSTAFSALDKAVKTNLIHKNKANRLKSRLTKTAKEATVKVLASKTPKKAPKKKSSK